MLVASHREVLRRELYTGAVLGEWMKLGPYATWLLQPHVVAKCWRSKSLHAAVTPHPLVKLAGGLVLPGNSQAVCLHHRRKAQRHCTGDSWEREKDHSLYWVQKLITKISSFLATGLKVLHRVGASLILSRPSVQTVLKKIIISFGSKF